MTELIPTQAFSSIFLPTDDDRSYKPWGDESDENRYKKQKYMLSDFCDFLCQVFHFRLHPQHQQPQIMQRNATVCFNHYIQACFIYEVIIRVVNCGILLSFPLSHIVRPEEQLMMNCAGLRCSSHPGDFSLRGVTFRSWTVSCKRNDYHRLKGLRSSCSCYETQLFLAFVRDLTVLQLMFSPTLSVFFFPHCSLSQFMHA